MLDKKPHTHPIASQHTVFQSDTVPKSRYDPSDILRHWPPATRGARPIAKRWYATIGAGRLLLQEAEPPGHMPKGSPPRSVTVNLEGCRVRVVTEGLSGRTVWMRKVWCWR